MKPDKFKHQIEARTLSFMDDEGELNFLSKEVKPSRMDNRYLKEKKRKQEKEEKKANRWN